MSLVEQMKDPKYEGATPHEVAKEIKRLYSNSNTEGILALKAAYIEKIRKKEPKMSVGIAVDAVDNDLIKKAALADEVNRAGGEADGQLFNELREDGLIAKFVRSCISF